MKLVSLIASLALLSCEKSSTDQPSPTPATSGSNDGVQLVSLGGDGKRVLQYRMKKGAHTPLEMAMNMDLDVTGRPMTMPTIVMTLDLAVDDVLADGSARIKSSIKSARIDPRAGATVDAAALAPMTQMLSGLVYTFTLAPDGTVTRGAVTGGSGQMQSQLEDMTRSIEQVAMRLPVVPVGVGASWSSKKTVGQNGVSVTTVTTTKLTAITGDTFEFTSDTTLSAPNQQVTQHGITMDIRDVGGGGTGKGTVDLTTLGIRGTITSEFRGVVEAAGQTSNMRVVMSLDLK
jgi:hypothetical protein